MIRRNFHLSLPFKFISFCAIFFIFYFLSFICLVPVFAIDNAGLSISPPTFELSANPGGVLENSIKVENISAETLKIIVDRRNFTAIGEEGAVGLTEEENSFSLASWITVSPSELEIPPKSARVFNFKINVPINAEPGGHFGSIVFRIGRSGSLSQTGASLTQELGALVLLRIAGDSKEEATLQSFISQKKFFEYGPVEFEMKTKNNGNVHLKPKGTITISNSFGKKVGVIDIDPKNVLPGAVRKNSAIWEKKLLFGKYTAVLSLVYGGGQGKMITATTTFIGFPYRVGGVVFVILIVLFFFLRKGRKRIKLALRILFSGK
jgi:hypothetical protein